MSKQKEIQRKNLICPITLIYPPEEHGLSYESGYYDCIKENCALWEESMEMCSLKLSAKGMLIVLNELMKKS